MDIRILKTQLTTILAVSKPIIQKLVDEKVIPAIKTLAYKTLQKKADRIVNNLLRLKEKALKEEDENKRTAHLIGLDLGADAIIAIGEKLTEAGKLLKDNN